MLLDLADSALELKNYEDCSCDSSYEHTSDVKALVLKQIGDVAVCTAAECINESGVILDGNGKSLKNYVRKSSEDEHTCKGYNEGRYSYISDPESLECTDQNTDGKHCDYGYDEGAIVLSHKNCSDCTGKTYNGTNGKVDVTSGQYAEKHTGCKNEHISVL